MVDDDDDHAKKRERRNVKKKLIFISIICPLIYLLSYIPVFMGFVVGESLLYPLADAL